MDALIIKPEKGSDEAAAASDAAASLQQFLANSGTLMQFLPASSDGSTQNAAGSLPWMPYQMMVLPQSLLTAQNVAGMTQDANILLAASGDMQGIKVEKSGTATGGQSVAALLQKRDSGTTVAQQQVAAQLAAAVSSALPDGMTQSPRPQAAATAGAGDGNGLKPPKKPLTPYMTFSKMIWPQVKAAHPHLSSVCELGAVVGSLWRDLDPVEKQQYNEQFTREKWVYDEELRSYLKATGLTASDLVKPKVKRPSRPSTSHAHPPAAAKPAAAATANGTAGFATTGQQLVESLLGSQMANGAGSSTAAEGWNGQAAQQLLAQLGLSGQTLYANADGTISVDGSLLTIGGRPVQLATSQIAAAASDQAQQMVADNVATSTAGWAWHQPTSNAASSTTSTAQQQANDAAAAASNMVLYQLLANGGATMSSDGNAAAAAGNAAPQLYYSVDAYGQLVAHEAKPTNESNLQQQIVALRRALDEKTREADSLRSQLTEVYSNIERYNKANGEGHSSAAGNNGLEDGRNGSSPASESRKAD